MSSSNSRRFARVAVRAGDPARAARLSAEAFAAGALGIEERGSGLDIELIIYAEEDAIAGLRELLEAVAGNVGTALPVPDRDWEEAWRAHLEAIEISDRLVVRPSFVPFALEPGQREVLIDPGQAFGTGSHESTRLALEWISALAPARISGARVLDVGVGSGVLALAALELGAERAVGLDLDPLAAEAARQNGRANGKASKLRCFTGGIEALADGARFQLVLANLLRSELEPILSALAARVGTGGVAVLSGLLESERLDVIRSAERASLREVGVRRAVDASGVAWIALCCEPMR